MSTTAHTSEHRDESADSKGWGEQAQWVSPGRFSLKSSLQQGADGVKVWSSELFLPWVKVFFIVVSFFLLMSLSLFFSNSNEPRSSGLHLNEAFFLQYVDVDDGAKLQEFRQAIIHNFTDPTQAQIRRIEQLHRSTLVGTVRPKHFDKEESSIRSRLTDIVVANKRRDVPSVFENEIIVQFSVMQDLDKSLADLETCLSMSPSAARTDMFQSSVNALKKAARVNEISWRFFSSAPTYSAPPGPGPIQGAQPEF